MKNSNLKNQDEVQKMIIGFFSEALIEKANIELKEKEDGVHVVFVYKNKKIQPKTIKIVSLDIARTIAQIYPQITLSTHETENFYEYIKKAEEDFVRILKSKDFENSSKMVPKVQDIINDVMKKIRVISKKGIIPVIEIKLYMEIWNNFQGKLNRRNLINLF